MPNIRRSINTDTEEISGYTGLLGAILNQAVKELQKSYSKLIRERTNENYSEFRSARLFFENDCNGYCEEELSKYILEKALLYEEENYKEKDIVLVKQFILAKESVA